MTESRTAARAALEREHRAIEEQRRKLVAEIESRERELQALKDEAQSEQDKAKPCHEAATAVDHLHAMEQARTDLRRVESELTSVRQRCKEEAEAHRERLDEARSIYQMYAASTGIRWDFNAEHVAGYVALGKAKRFDISDEDHRQGSESAKEKGSRVLAEKLWQEVEASLPPAESASAAPWPQSPHDPAMPGGA